MTEIEAAKDVATRYFKAVEEGDVAAIEALHAPDASWWILGFGDLSRDAFIGAIKDMLLTADTRKVTVIGMVAEGDTVAVEVRSEMHFGDKVYANAYHDLIKVRDGQIVHGKEYLDTSVTRAFQTSMAE